MLSLNDLMREAKKDVPVQLEGSSITMRRVVGNCHVLYLMDPVTKQVEPRYWAQNRMDRDAHLGAVEV
jgi:hypothetical protein